MARHHNRRGVLRVGGVALVGALAGCASPGSDDDGGDEESDGDGDGDEEEGDDGGDVY